MKHLLTTNTEQMNLQDNSETVNGSATAYLKPSPPQLVTASLGYVGNNATPPRPSAWNRNVPPDKLSFTMRREFEKAKEEAELIQQLRSVSWYSFCLPYNSIITVLQDCVIAVFASNKWGSHQRFLNRIINFSILLYRLSELLLNSGKGCFHPCEASSCKFTWLSWACSVHIIEWSNSRSWWCNDSFANKSLGQFSNWYIIGSIKVGMKFWIVK